MASQRKPPSPLIQSISAPFERSPGWVKILYWCILGAVSAVLVATLISCPILLLLRFLYPGDFQTVLTQNQGNSADTTLTPAPISSPVPGGTPGSGTASPGTGSASDGTSASSTATAEAQAEGTDSSLSPTGSPENSTDSASSSATGTAANDGSANSATPDGSDSNGSSGSDSESSSVAGTPSDGGSTTSTTPGADSADSASSQPTSTATNSTAPTATASPTDEPSPTSTPIPPSPTTTPTPTVPTATSTPREPTPPPRRTPAPYTVVAPTPVPLPTNTPRPTSTATPATPTRVAVQPVSTLIVAPAAAPNLPGGILSLLDPISIQIPPSRGPTTFVWEWEGDSLPPEYGFEVRVWLNGEPQAGVHDAVLDRREERIEFLGSSRYQLKVGNIRYAQGVLGREGIYNWTVAVVRVSPTYADLGLQAVPARFRYEPFPVGR